MAPYGTLCWAQTTWDEVSTPQAKLQDDESRPSQPAAAQDSRDGPSEYGLAHGAQSSRESGGPRASTDEESDEDADAERLRRDLHDLRTVAQKVGKASDIAVLSKVERDLERTTAVSSNPPPSPPASPSSWHSTWHVLKGSPKPHAAPNAPAAPPAVNASAAAAASGIAATPVRIKTDWDTPARQFDVAVPVPPSASAKRVAAEAYGPDIAKQVCSDTCWAKPQLHKLCLDKRRYVVGERIVVCLHGLPGQKGDGVGVYHRGKLYMRRDTTVSGTGAAPGKPGNADHAADLSFFATLDKNLKQDAAKDAKAKERMVDPDPTYWRNSDGTVGQGSWLSARAGIFTSALIFRPISLPEGVYSIRLFFGSDPSEAQAAFTFAVIDGGEKPNYRPPVAELTVLNINMAQSKGHLPHIANTIASAEADLISMQECDEPSAVEVRELLKSAGSHPQYAHTEMAVHKLPQPVGTAFICILSRFPIVKHYDDPSLYVFGVQVRTPTGRRVRFFNSHLARFPYGPYLIRDGLSVYNTLHQTSPQTVALTVALSTLVEAEDNDVDLTTILVGNHNSPSALDWSAANEAQNGAVVEWGPSMAMLNHDFIDAYRTAHPDPTVSRGFTWTPGLDGRKGNLPIDEVHDRIDFIFHRPEDGWAMDVPQAYILDPDLWPMNHRAVCASFAFKKVELGPVLPPRLCSKRLPFSCPPLVRSLSVYFLFMRHVLSTAVRHGYRIETRSLQVNNPLGSNL
jgi:hypothetical protein